jgi:anti-sigma factor RsiW
VLLTAFFGRELVRTLPSKSEVSSFATAAVDAHLRSLQPGHLVDVPSSDQHTVKPWFDGKINFAPAVRDLSDNGFPLEGGRLDVLDGRNVAALVYGRRKHIINVFAMESSASSASPESGELHGYRWLCWESGGFTYIAVSDTAAVDLEQLRDLLKKE